MALIKVESQLAAEISPGCGKQQGNKQEGREDKNNVTTVRQSAEHNMAQFPECNAGATHSLSHIISCKHTCARTINFDTFQMFKYPVWIPYITLTLELLVNKYRSCIRYHQLQHCVNKNNPLQMAALERSLPLFELLQANS